jgi:2-polyprenyl-3-methyl-5-hydroxy-6-metoxy-1,4-benzoquinol methylase
MDENSQQANLETLAAWDANAGYWDEKMGEGNDFVEVLIRPATERLLAIRPGERVLDIACGNGLAARRLAEMGAEVVAFDFSPEMIARARARPCEAAGHIDYRVLDATDEIALLALGAGKFDAALCNMALFDMANIDPLLRALSRLLRPGGRFVFSIVHPCFNNPYAMHLAEMSFHEGQAITRYSIKLSGYMTASTSRDAAISGQPRLQLIFHRPLGEILTTCFSTGFVMDAFEECAFPPNHPDGKNPLSWNGKFSQFPPVLVARMLRNNLE